MPYVLGSKSRAKLAGVHPDLVRVVIATDTKNVARFWPDGSAEVVRVG